MKKYNVWTRVDMPLDEVTKFLNERNLAPGHFMFIPYNDGEDVTIIYLAATI